MTLVSIVGGVGLVLFGVRFLRKGLDRLFGDALVRWIVRMTSHRLRAFGAGIVIGTVAPSSTGLAMLGGELLGKGSEISSQRMLAVLLGAGVGLTVTVQLLAFRIESMAGMLVVLGVIGFQFCRRAVLRGVGQCLLALGLIFIAMAMIGQGAHEISSDDDVRDVLGRLQGHPWLILVTVSCLSVLLQSSTATIALGLALASSRLLHATALLPWVIGTNLGLGLTSLLTGWAQLESRRLGLGNLLAKLFVAVPLLIWLGFTQNGFDWLPGSVMRQTALAHTLFNLLVGLVTLPFLSPLHLLTTWIAPASTTGSLVNRASFLEPRALETPAVALAFATRETLSMADEVRGMLDRFWNAFDDRDVELARRIQRQDDVVDRMNVEIKNYLTRVGDNRSAADTDWQLTLLTFSAELEAIGDLVDKHLCDALLKQRSERVELTAFDYRHLAEAHRRVLTAFDLSVSFLTTRGMTEAKSLLTEKRLFNDWCRDLQRQHYERLAWAPREAMASSIYFLDSLNALRRINSHCCALGYTA